jgi:hypothetical protein
MEDITTHIYFIDTCIDKMCTADINNMHCNRIAINRFSLLIKLKKSVEKLYGIARIRVKFTFVITFINIIIYATSFLI